MKRLIRPENKDARSIAPGVLVTKLRGVARAIWQSPFDRRALSLMRWPFLSEGRPWSLNLAISCRPISFPESAVRIKAEAQADQILIDTCGYPATRPSHDR